MGYLGCIEYESNHEEYFGDCRYNGETTVMMKNFVDQVRNPTPLNKVWLLGVIDETLLDHLNNPESDQILEFKEV